MFIHENSKLIFTSYFEFKKITYSLFVSSLLISYQTNMCKSNKSHSFNMKLQSISNKFLITLIS